MSGMERLQRIFGGGGGTLGHPPPHPILPPSITLSTSTSPRSPSSKCSNTMGCGEKSPYWSVFDSVKKIPASPEALMAEINTGITNLEYARATALLETPSFSHLNSNITESDAPGTPPPQYDVRMADEAYRAGCAALAAGKLDEALHSLNISLSKCPPDKTSAVAKLQSLISLTSQQLQRSSN